jgi:hypothetical protein
MASPEWLRAHRELQYLRAAMWECQRGSRTDRRHRRRYAELRWRKLQAVNPRFRRKRRPGKPINRRDDDPDLR